MSVCAKQKRVDWDELLNDDEMVYYCTLFSLGLSSGRNFERLCNLDGKCSSGVIRQLIRKRGIAKAREVVRKALKRRNVLNKYNIVAMPINSQMMRLSYS